MENFDNNVEKLMQELARQNKRLFVIAQVLGIISVVFFLGMFLLACFTLEDNELASGIVMCISLVLLFIGLFYAFKTEIDAGYYQCKNCKHKFVPTYKQAIFAAHTPTKKHLKCPQCGKKTWTKKVMSKYQIPER